MLRGVEYMLSLVWSHITLQYNFTGLSWPITSQIAGSILIPFLQNSSDDSVFFAFNHALLSRCAASASRFGSGIETLATATESSEIDIPKKEMLKITALIHHNGVNDGRLLRSVNTDTEERDIASFIRWRKYSWKVKGLCQGDARTEGAERNRVEGKPEIQVLEEFKINSRAPMALDDMETRQVNKWLNEMLPSQKVWIELALKGVPANQLVENSAYKLYLRYAIEYDDLLFQRIKESDKIEIWERVRSKEPALLEVAKGTEVKGQIPALLKRVEGICHENDGSPRRWRCKSLLRLVLKRTCASNDIMCFIAKLLSLVLNL
ncbi:hypothetical protein GQ600_22340 [Phytophthora cactorum]|nr:hypothetical protein GQ600_22340 [Phytophthora cactorum]